MNALRESGATLVSLIVGIAIVVVVFALSSGAVLKAIERGRGVRCVSNLRQIGVALHLYIAEHNGKFPPNRANPYYKNEQNPSGVHWQDYLKDYLSIDLPSSDRNRTSKRVGAFWCPADRARINTLSHQSYGYNHKIGGSEPLEQQNIRAQTNPAQRIYLIDASCRTLSTTRISSNSWPFNGGPLSHPDADTWVDFRHANRANALFLDGHVTSFFVHDLHGRHPDSIR